MRKRALAVALLLVSCSAPGEVAEEHIGQVQGALTDVASFGANPGNLAMHVYVPMDMPAGPRPLVVALHGCTQTAAAYEAAGWEALADAWKFYVLYPEQNTAKNNSLGCFNWGGRWKDAPQTFVLSPEPLDVTTIQRGHDENESIKEMVDKMKADHAIDSARVFVTGLSAGGGMVSVLLATWPDVFSGGAIFAGIPYGCATNHKTTDEAQNCLKDYTGANAYLDRMPQEWGDLVRAAGPPGFKGPWPRVSIWYGTADSVVNPKNADELTKQWTNVNGVSTPTMDMVEGFPHTAYKDASGKILVETYAITGQSHGTEVAPSKPIDPGKPDGAKCGTAGSYILSTSICSTYYAGKFFGLDQAAGASSSSSSGGSSTSSTSSGGGTSSGGASPSGSGTPGTPGSAPSTCAFAPPRTDASIASLVLFGLVVAARLRRRAR